jgi:predicted nucleotide-binding protein
VPFHIEVSERPVGPDFGFRVTYKFDLSREDLDRVLVAPYRAGQPLVIDGRIIRVADINEVRVAETAEPATDLLPAIEKALEKDFFDYPGRADRELIRRGLDRTNDFITTPPGAVPTEVNVPRTPAADKRRVLVVHGRNMRAARGLFTFLRAAGLEPLEWAEAVRATGEGSPYVGTILDQAFALAQAVVVLLTPDDEVRLREELRDLNEAPHEMELHGQARPNVLFEAGMAFGRQPDRTILVEMGALRPFSDVAGRHVVRLEDTPESRNELLTRLETAGCHVRREGNHWLSEGALAL